jgi:serine protease DegS
LAGLKSALLFILQSIVVGLAVAFLIVILRPELLPMAGNTAPASYADAVEKSASAVASVTTKRLVETGDAQDQRKRFRVETSYGSAVAIDPQGYLVTNYHVVAQAAEITVQLADGRQTIPQLVGVDAETDLALLKVDLGTIPVVSLGNSGRVRIGDVVLAIGNPYGLTKSVTQGIVSGTGRGVPNLTTFADFIQTDAAINAGNSGGALVNTEGELVGINTAVLAQDVRTEGISFAIPVDLVRGVVTEIREHGRVIRGWLGLIPDDMTTAERSSHGIERNVGILLSKVVKDGPADKAHLQVGDVITAINGESISDSNQARLLVARITPGEEIDITGIRDGKEFDTTLIAAERPGAPD